MSKHVTHAHCRVLHDVETMSIPELEEQYQIEVDEDGNVWDVFEYKEFSDIHQWAEYINQRDREDLEGTFQGGKIKSSRSRSSDDY